jgi:hypothetical protein
LKKITAIVLCFFIVVSSMTTTVTCLIFKINQDKIAKTLCVLRAKANNTCNGRCVLNAKLKEIANSEKKESSRLLEQQEVMYVVLNQTFTISSPGKIILKKKTIAYSESQNPKTILFGLLRPPIC